jgi:multidrug efflux pump subunit AcrA (membrane-fusion protein)
MTKFCKKFISKCNLFILILLVGLLLPQCVFAHGGTIEISSGGARGPVILSSAQQAAIAVQTVEAGPHPLADILYIYGEVQLLPNRQAAVSLRGNGQIKEIDVNLGDLVKKGQRLALVQPRFVGNEDIIVTSPIGGIVDTINSGIGQPVEPNAPIFHVSDRSQMIAVGKVYEEDLTKVKIGQEARVSLLAYPNQVFVGKVVLMDPNLDVLSRTVKIWVRLDNPKGLLKPGMFANIGVVLRKSDADLTIPNSAIIEANDEKFVFVCDGKTFNRVEVKIGISDDEYSAITDGLIPGDEVVTQGNHEIYTRWLTGGGQSKKGTDND